MLMAMVLLLLVVFLFVTVDGDVLGAFAAFGIRHRANSAPRPFPSRALMPASLTPPSALFLNS